MTSHTMLTGDCLEVLSEVPDNSIDLVICSPPYEDARTYGINFNLKGQDWVDWALVRYLECVRVCRGLVCWVVEGKTNKFRWTATPALLMADLHRAGVSLRKPPVFHRVGVCGSGGPDWWRNDYEFCVCSSKGKLPWSDNTANGHPPKYSPGGDPSNRRKNGTRTGQMSLNATEPKTLAYLNGDIPAGSELHTKNNGNSMRVKCYTPPALANAGNVIHCSVGGGRMGSLLAHNNEAPFPEKLVEPFIQCFCPPDGTVLDCFAGSGTTAAVAKRLGRNSISIDVRDCDNAGKTLIERRLAQ